MVTSHLLVFALMSVVGPCVFAALVPLDTVPLDAVVVLPIRVSGVVVVDSVIVVVVSITYHSD